MKTLFPGYYPYTNEQVKSFIEESTVVFGAEQEALLKQLHNKPTLGNTQKITNTVNSI